MSNFSKAFSEVSTRQALASKSYYATMKINVLIVVRRYKLSRKEANRLRVFFLGPATQPHPGGRLR